MKTALMLTLTLATLSQTALADSYECRVVESTYTGDVFGKGGSTKERACGTQRLDTENAKERSAYFDCNGGVSVEILPLPGNESGKYIQLSQLAPGEVTEWGSRSPTNTAVIELPGGISPVFHLALGMDRSTSLREKKTSVYLTCQKIANP